MNKITKIISLLIALCLAFSICSCAKGDIEEESAEAVQVVVDTDAENTEPDDSPGDNSTNNSNPDNTPPSDSGKPSTDDSDKQTDDKPAADDTKEPDTDTSSKPDTDNPQEDGNTESDDLDPYAPEAQFDTYVSNTFVPTGNHFALVSATETTKTFRGVFPVQENGKLEYCFYFSNCVDSTWGGGDVAYRNMPTEGYEILSAAIMVSKTTDVKSVSRRTSLTFDGKKTRTVEPDEMFWSDPLSFNVSDGEYLVFEWKVKYTFMPCNKINGVGYGYVSTDNGVTFTKASDGMPMPSMIGAKRENAKSVAFIGDSITAGEGAGEYNGYVAQISKQLGKDISVWNLGLGYARANDAVNSPAWMKKAKTADTVAICFGVNDINSGVYNLGTRTAEQVIEDITAIAKEISDAGAKVIIISTPPYTYADAARIQKWQTVVKGLLKLAKDNGYDYFDFGACVADPADPTKPAYGGHPNGDGCKVVADTFIKEFKAGTITFK